MLAFCVGLFLGAFIGVFIMGIIQINRDYYDE